MRRLGAKFSGKKMTYGATGHLRARSLRMRDARGMDFDLHHGRQRARIRLNYLGRHNVTNALGAAALALAAGVDLAAVRRGLAQAKPFTMRMQQENWRGIGILNDSYNANPGSMRAALETLASMGERGKKIAVLGDMFESASKPQTTSRTGPVRGPGQYPADLLARRPSAPSSQRGAWCGHEIRPGDHRCRSRRSGKALKPTAAAR